MVSDRKLLRRWNTASAVLHFSSFIAQCIVVALNADSLFRVPVRILIGQEFSVLGCIAVPHLLLAFAPITSIFHLLAAQRGRLDAVLTHGRDGLRYIEYSITAGIMTAAIALLSGIWDLNILIVLVLLNIVVQALGYEFEFFYSKDEDGAWRLFGWSSLTFLASWYLIFYSFFNAVVSLEGDIPWFIYTVIFTLFGINLMFPSLVVLNRVKWEPFRCFKIRLQDPTVYAIAFMVLSFVAKFVLNWFVLLGGLNARVPLADSLCPAP